MNEKDLGTYGNYFVGLYNESVRSISFHFVSETLISGLSDNGLDDSYTHILTGYVRNDAFLLEVHNCVKKLKDKNPGLLYRE